MSDLGAEDGAEDDAFAGFLRDRGGAVEVVGEVHGEEGGLEGEFGGCAGGAEGGG